jgi:UDP-N-acetyl-D-mannosaminuronate dehydrogenase
VEVWPELEDAKVEKNLNAVLPQANVVIFAVGHNQYKHLDPAEVVSMCQGTKPLIVDCSNFLTDEVIDEYKKLGCKVRGVGKGHII